MRSFLRPSILALSLILGSAAVGHAGDLCLNLGGVLYVGKAVSVPGKGKCNVWKVITPLGGDCQSSGAICRASNDTHVDISILSMCDVGSFVDRVTLPYPSLTGGSESFQVIDVGSGGGTSSFGASKIPCSPTNIPVPAQDSEKGRFLASR